MRQSARGGETRSSWRAMALLAGLRSEPRYVEVMQRIERDVAATKARAEFGELDERAGVPVAGQ